MQLVGNKKLKVVGDHAVLSVIFFIEFLTTIPSFAIGKISDVLSQIGKMNCNQVLHKNPVYAKKLNIKT